MFEKYVVANKLVVFVLVFNSFNFFSQLIKPRCLDGNCKNKSGTYIYSDSSIYVGEFNDRFKSGLGKISYRNKSFYEGQWLNDKRHGRGIYVDSVGNKYEGNWADDKESGKGKYTDKKGNVYEGTWINGELLGSITIQYRNKNFYQGDYNQGLNGKGKFRYADGSVYTGSFIKNKRSGFGEMIYNFGLTYRGNWVSNEVEGIGDFLETKSQLKIASGKWKTEKTKEGDSKFLTDSGYLVCYLANKNLYYGNSLNGTFDGKGHLVFSNGEIYDGSFSNGKFNGNGKYIYKDKSDYSGEWKDNLKNGFGVQINADKSVIEGYWSSDVYVGLKTNYERLGQISCDKFPRLVLQNKFLIIENRLNDKKFNLINEYKNFEFQIIEGELILEGNNYGASINSKEQKPIILIKDQKNKKKLFKEGFNFSSEFVYDDIYKINNSRFLLTVIRSGLKGNNSEDINSEFQEELFGLIDENGKELLKPIFSRIELLDSSLFIVCYNKLWGLCSDKGLITKLKYTQIWKPNEGFLRVNLYNKEGFIDLEGNEVISPKYDLVEVFSDGLAVVYLGNNYGYVNKMGQEIIPINSQFDASESFDNDFYEDDMLSLGRSYRSFKNGFAKIIINGKYGIIKKDGSKLFNETFDGIFISDKKNKKGQVLFIVRKDLKTTDFINNQLNGIINEKGGVEIDYLFHKIYEFNDCILTARNTDFGLINKYGSEVFTPKFKNPTNHMSCELCRSNENLMNQDSLLIVEMNGKYGLVNLNGKFILECKYDRINSNFSYDNSSFGFYQIELNNMFGLVNNKGEVIVPIRNEGGSGDYGYFSFNNGEEEFLVNKYGKEIFRCFDCTWKSKTLDNYFLILTKDEVGRRNITKIINENGKLISDSVYSDVEFIKDTEFIIVRSNNKFGLIDLNGNVVIDIKFDSIEYLGNNLCQLNLNGQCEVIKFP